MATVKVTLTFNNLAVGEYRLTSQLLDGAGLSPVLPVKEVQLVIPGSAQAPISEEDPIVVLS